MDTVLLRQRAVLLRSQMLLQLLLLLGTAAGTLKRLLRCLREQVAAGARERRALWARRRALKRELNRRPSTQLKDYYEEEPPVTVGKALGTVLLMALIMGLGPLGILGGLYLLWLLAR